MKTISEEIDKLFKPIERKIFYTTLYCSLATFIIIPIILLLI